MRITRIGATPLLLPFREPYYWAGRCDLDAVVVLVEVETDEGISGFAEVTGGYPPAATEAALGEIAELFVGRSPLDIAGLCAEAYHIYGLSQAGNFANLIVGAVEMALFDIMGKALDQPVHRLLGGACRDEVDYFAFVHGRTADELVEDARTAVADGYSVIYMKVGRGEVPDMENVAAVRDAIGDRKLRLDANGAWSVHEAIYMLRRLARFEPEWIEQPSHTKSLAALKHVKESVPIPVAADDIVYSLFDVYEICRQRAADVLVLSPHETGGLLPFRKAAAIAEAAGIAINLHGRFVTGITDLALHCVALTLPNLTDGNQIMHQILEEDIISAPDITPHAGRLGLFERPGFGFDLDQQAVERAAQLYRQQSDVQCA